ncbi:MAG TPA: S41 family peptidase [Luteimonas sp.]|nr:S41 family peptidase [Luteimonas sp.]
MRWLGILLCLLSATAHARPPRATADAVAQAIEDRYFDPARGSAIAGELRTAAARGEFDALHAPLDLAAALGARLRPLDGHFNVRWSSPAGLAEGVPPPRRPPPAHDHGIRGVRILPGNIGYIDLAFFAHFEFADKAAPPRVAIDAALALLQWTDAVIIDLRGNGGGSPAMVGYLTSAFTQKGADIYNRFSSREGSTSEAPLDWHPSPRLDVPLYVLTSGRTGSAAEALAYTLQSAGRALVVGERSGGAANPGGPVEVGEGFSVFVSTGSPVNPLTGRNWEGVGVQPGLGVPAHDALHAAQVHALQRRLADGGAGPADTGARWALEGLQARDQPAAEVSALAGTYGDVRIAVEDGALVMRQGRRPPQVLRALASGDFFVEDDPLRRVAFARDPAGVPVALDVHTADGNRNRFRRSAP